jgi:hypothetical protein
MLHISLPWAFAVLLSFALTVQTAAADDASAPSSSTDSLDTTSGEPDEASSPDAEADVPTEQPEPGDPSASVERIHLVVEAWKAYRAEGDNALRAKLTSLDPIEWSTFQEQLRVTQQAARKVWADQSNSFTRFLTVATRIARHPTAEESTPAGELRNYEPEYSGDGGAVTSTRSGSSGGGGGGSSGSSGDASSGGGGGGGSGGGGPASAGGDAGTGDGLKTEMAAAAPAVSPNEPTAPTTGETPADTQTPWYMFDALGGDRKPREVHDYLQPIQMVWTLRHSGGLGVWPKGADRSEPHERFIREWLAPRLPADRIVCINIEHWNDIDEKIEKLGRVADIIREERPDVVFGFYGQVPAGFKTWKHSGLSEDHPVMVQWREDNEKLRALAEKVDVLFPSLYTNTEDPAAWQERAQRTIEKAREFGKPVIPFLWPEYPGYGPTSHRDGDYLEPEFWEMEMRTVRALADGVVLYATHRGIDYGRWWEIAKSVARTKPAALTGD